jgi:16S rRNA (uracil1498-N3)-methyltransferase
MTRRRWIADEVSGDQAILTGRNAEHLSRVLRARIGQQFEVATGDGVRLGEIIEIQPERVVFSLRDAQISAEDASMPTVHLYLAIFKFDRFEWAVEKCTELGVTAIVPVVAGRTDAHLAVAAKKRVERWRRIAHEASQQSRRDEVPELRNPEKLSDALTTAPGKRIVLSEAEREQSLSSLAMDCHELSLAIGPEGGWTSSELDLFRSNGWSSASLGSTILRSETAAIAALAITQRVFPSSTVGR